MKEIRLSRGMVTLVDDEDYEYLNQWKWQAHKEGKYFYARHTIHKNCKVSELRMHRLIMNCPKGLMVDHIDHDTLNNQKYNLRICTPTQNVFNKVSYGTTGYKGVYYYYRKLVNGDKIKVIKSSIRLNNKFIHLGYFDTEKEAAMAYDKKAIELFGEFAYLNFKT